LKELRAQSFAQECLVPRSVLIQIANRHGLKWNTLSAEDIARLTADSHVEQRFVLRAAFDAELITSDQLESYQATACETQLRNLSTHALNTREYLQTLAAQSPKWIAENRNTEVGRRSLRLPSTYVSQVIDALRAGEISEGKAAEMLMMDRDTFRSRFNSMQDAEKVA
jgi:hypothetical protein